MLTQKELAKKLGVSQQAVSFALNGGGTLKQATRDFISQEARKAGYRSKSNNRLLKDGKSDTVALIVSGNFHTLPGVMLSAMRDILRENEIHLTIFGAEAEDFADSANPPRLVRELSADGFLVMYDEKSALPEQIARYRIPSIWINQKQNANSVYPDDFSIASQLVCELGGSSRKRFLYFGPSGYGGDAHYSVYQRREGFLDGVDKLGVSGEIFNSDTYGQSSEGLEGAIASILKRKRKRPNVVVCYRAEDAEAFVFQASQLGYEIPVDLVVACFSWGRVAIGHRDLTRAFVPIHTVGVEALKMLFRRIESSGEDVPSLAIDQFVFHPGSFATC